MRSITGVAGASLAASIALVVAAGATASAQPSAGGNKVAAEALFEDGRKLVAEGKYAEACSKFADSERLDPSLGTLLNLASCFEKLGRTASAWVTYREAASAANAAGRKDYIAIAERHADALATKLARLTVIVAQPIDGLRIVRDGVVVDRAEWGTPIPIDTGSHAIEAAAPGHRGWASTVDVTQDGTQATLTVPALEAAPEAAPAAASPPAPEPAPLVAPPTSLPPPDAGSSSGRGQRSVGLVLAGLGVVGLGTGTGLALSAKGKYNDSVRNHCERGNPNLCDPTGVSLRNDARSQGDAATLAFGIGAAALVAGGVLWLTAPSGQATRDSGAPKLVLIPTLGGAVVKGAW
jgi:hypothetical protein